MFFVQGCLRYLFDEDIGGFGPDKDGVDGIFDGHTQQALYRVLRAHELTALHTEDEWMQFLMICRDAAFGL
jgi:hypothetical protein